MFTKLLLERMARSFLASVLAVLAAGAVNADTSIPALTALVVGAIASGVSACISMISQFVGDPDSTSFIK